MTRAPCEKKLESILRGALERDEFCCTSSRSQTRLRAYLRVRGAHTLAAPRGALVPPGDFIPVLEETGLITPWGVGRASACEQIVMWGVLASPRCDCDHLSADSCIIPDFPKPLGGPLRSMAWMVDDGSRNTESSLRNNPEEAQNTLAQLKARV